LVGIFDVKSNITVSAVWVYGTGNALTVPLSRYNGYSNFNTRNNLPTVNNPASILYSGRAVQEYGEKNAFRAEPYHRLDLGVQFHKKMRRHERTWEISIYNAYNRKNPFFYQLGNKINASTNQTTTILQRYSIFPIIPSVSYNFKF
jgi:hypothetical protein